MTNNFMMADGMKEETDKAAAEPYFHKHEMEIESGYPSESDAQAQAINK